MLNTCENRVYISRLLWGSRLSESWPQISCSWTNNECLGIPWGWFCLPCPGVSSGVMPSSVSGRAGVTSCGMLWEEVVRGLWYGRWAFHTLFRHRWPSGSFAGGFRLFNGCLRVKRKRFSFWVLKIRYFERTWFWDLPLLFNIYPNLGGESGGTHSHRSEFCSQLVCSDFLVCLFAF